MHLKFLFFGVLLRVFSIQGQVESITLRLKGAIVALVRGETWEIKDIIERNKSLMRFFMSGFNNSIYYERPDVIFFHDSHLPESYMDHITSNSTDLKISFIEIQFDGHAIMDEKNKPKLLHDYCPPNGMTEFMGFGYKNMCRFWFIGFMDYLLEYDWILRLDPDCKLIEPVFDLLTNDYVSGPLRNIMVASPVWKALYLQRWDKITSSESGDVTKGLGEFVREFAHHHNITGKFDSWNAPYSNALYINLKMVRSHTRVGKLIRKFMTAVDGTNCIYSNRWGDHDLWGAMAALVDQPVAFLKMPYYHGSHNVRVDGNSKSRQRGSPDIFYADNENKFREGKVMNSRVDRSQNQGYEFSAAQKVS